MFLSLLSDWSTTLSLVFGGCCSNAITLEQLTTHYPSAGSLLTFFQFILISLHGLPKHVTWTRYGPRFKPRRIPLTQYLIQVGLFYLISLLNNLAFGYDIPMSVHIIFRSGGLIVSMVLGWLIAGKRYNLTQVLSVVLVTAGVALTTLSATPSSLSSPNVRNTDTYNYILGIVILSFALILSGFLGLAQDWTYRTYGRPLPSPSSNSTTTASTSKNEKTSTSATQPPQWQESLFYLHFLALPMFILLRNDISTQMHEINTRGHLASFSSNLTLATPLAGLFAPPYLFDTRTLVPVPRIPPIYSSSLLSWSLMDTTPNPRLNVRISFPHGYIPLFLNTITQLFCVAGVHRLTTRVSALTVTLILVVRKAVSLILSILGPGIIPGLGYGKRREVDQRMMWLGAGLVLFGTVLYGVGTTKRKMEKGKTD